MDSRKQFVEEMLRKYSGNKAISSETTLADLGIDSLSLAEMLFEYEDRFNEEVDIRVRPQTVQELFSLLSYNG